MRNSIRQLILYIVLAVFLFQSTIAFAASDSQCVLALSYLARPATTQALDVPPKSMSEAMLDVRKIIIQTEPEEFNALWQTVSKKDLLEITKKVRAGQIAATDEQKNRLYALEDFVKSDRKNSLWASDNAWSSLHTNYPEFMGPSHKSRLGGTIARIDTYALTEVEKEIFNTALNKDSRLQRGNMWQRLFRHPYRVMQNIFKYNNQIRERLEHIEDVPAAMEREIQEENLKLTADEQAELDKYFNLKRASRTKLREELAKVYGQDITTGGFQAIVGSGATDIYDIDKRITDMKVIQSEVSGGFIETSEKAVDGLNQILNQARKRQGLAERSEVDQDVIELRVRHHQHRRQYTEKMHTWISHMSKGTGEYIGVRYYWYETEYYYVTERDAQGKMQRVQKSRQVRKSASASVEVSYFDVLVDRLADYSVGRSFRNGTIESVSGDDQLLGESKQAAALQMRYYELTKLENTLIEMLETHAQSVLSTQNQDRMDHEKTKQLMMLWQSLNDGIKELLSRKDSASEVRSRWSNDNYEHFLKRNELLRVALDDLREVYEIYSEQWRRGEYELVITPDTLTHDWDRLQLRYMGAMARNTAVGLTTTGLSICTAEQFLSDSGSCLAVIWQYLAPFIEQLSNIF